MDDLLELVLTKADIALFSELATESGAALLKSVFPSPRTSDGHNYYTDVTGPSRAKLCLILFRLLEQLGADATGKSPFTGRIDCSKLHERVVGKPERQRLLVHLFTVLPELGFAACAKTLFNEVAYLQMTFRSIEDLRNQLREQLCAVLTAADHDRSQVESPPQRTSFPVEFSSTDNSSAVKRFTNTLCSHGLFLGVFKQQQRLYAGCSLRSVKAPSGGVAACTMIEEINSTFS
jgi:hypothetical protein